MKNIVPIIKRIEFNRVNIIIFLFFIFCFFSRLKTQFFFIDILGQLSFQILAGGILLFVILLILKKFRSATICISICILFFIEILSSCNNCNSFLDNKYKDLNKIRLITFNVFHNNEFTNFEDLVEMILIEDPDIIQFQEVSRKTQTKLKTLESFFPYNTGFDKDIKFFDSIILSKHPLKNIKKGDYYAITADLMLNEEKLTIIGIHITNARNQKTFDIAIKGMKYLKYLIGNTNENVILFGDLNMTSVSKRFTNFLQETNLYTYTSYKNPIFTWPTFLPNYLGIQVDHVLFSENLKVTRIKTANHFGSDHRPLIVDLIY